MQLLNICQANADENFARASRYASALKRPDSQALKDERRGITTMGEGNWTTLAVTGSYLMG